MGRLSRRKQEARADPRRRDARYGQRADRRGLRTPATLDGFRTALAAQGHDAVAEALLARHNLRMSGTRRIDTVGQYVCLPHLVALFPLDLALAELGLRPDRLPADMGKGWLEHVAWGLDSIVAAVRLLMSGQVVGAAVIARTQLERWTHNLAHNAGLTQQPAETAVDWMDRVWSADSRAIADAQPVTGRPDDPQDMQQDPDESADTGAPTGPEGEAGRLFAQLSEVLHARGPLLDVVRWDTARCLQDGMTEPAVLAFDIVLRTLQLTTARLQACVATAAEERGWPVLAQTVWAVRIVAGTEAHAKDLFELLWPITPELLDGSRSNATGAVAAEYRKAQQAMRSGKKFELPPAAWPVSALIERRHRALTGAAHALEIERDMLGETFDPKGISFLITEAVLAGELAAMVSRWLLDENRPAPASDALVVAATALRSSTWLWLEDDDRAMACLRVVVEQIARARVWRTKPAKAAALESNAQTTPRDWLEAAGWRRLSVLNRALGAFVHFDRRADPAAARAVLVEMQADPTSPTAPYTGRTTTLQHVIVLLAAEAVRWVEQLDEALAEACWTVLRLDDTSVTRGMEPYFERAWRLRGMAVRAEDTAATEAIPDG